GGSATPPERHPGGPCVIPSRTPLPTPFDRSTFRSLARLAAARRPPQPRCRAACALLLLRLGNAPGTAPRRTLRHPFTAAASDALRPENVPFLGTARGGPPAAAGSMPTRLRSPAPAARQRPRNGTSEAPASSLHGCRFRRPSTGVRSIPWHGSRRPAGRRPSAPAFPLRCPFSTESPIPPATAGRW